MKNLIKQANEILLKNGATFVIDERTAFESEGIRHPIALTPSSPRTVESFVNDDDECGIRITTSKEYGILCIEIQDDHSYRTYVTEAYYF